MGDEYSQARPMACVFFQLNDGQPFYYTSWGPTPIPDPIPPGLDNNHCPLSICASSRGFIICRDSESNYFIGNPYAQSEPRYRGPLRHPPTRHPPSDTDVVLSVHRPWGMPKPLFHITCAIRRDPSIYDFHTYSSNTQQCEIVPNTGVSCGRFAFWLTQNKRSVLRFDVLAETISFLELPRDIPRAEQARMQLGRAGRSLVLVIVNEAASTVELYNLIIDGRPWSELPVIFNLEIDTAAAWPSAPVGGSTLVFSEMPWPIRFESFKLDPLFWVAGHRVILDCRDSDPENRQHVMVVFDTEEPASIIAGVPHVCTLLLPSDFDWGSSN